MSLFIHPIGEAGSEGGRCTSSRCTFINSKPRADYWHVHDKRWVCMSCAQTENRKAIQLGYNKQCISGKEFLMNTLKG